jgi:hypothetical protein
MINFLISYWFFNKYLFKPALESINRKKLDRDMILAKIDEEERSLLLKEELKKAKVVSFQEKVEREYLVEKQESLISEIPIEVKIDSSEVQELRDEAKNVILQKVFYVD